MLQFSSLLLLSNQKIFTKSNQYEYKTLIKNIHNLSRSLIKKKISQEKWQKNLEMLFQQIDLKEVIQNIDLDNILKYARPKSKDVSVVPLAKPIRMGKYQKLQQQLFIVKKKHSIVPHGHNYMTSGFLVLKGNFRGRHYERIQDEKNHLIIEPTIDQSFLINEYSTISDHHNNIHWFEANSNYGVILNVHLKNLQQGPKKPGRVYIDPTGEKIKGNYIRAKRISRKIAYQKFG